MKLILLIWLLLLLCGCRTESPKPEPLPAPVVQEELVQVPAEQTLDETWGVTASVLFYDTAVPRMSLRLTEDGRKTLVTDGTYWLERDRDGEWVRVNTQKDTIWSAEPQSLFPGNWIGWNVSLWELCPDFSEGTYRIGVNVTETESGGTQCFYGTFTVTQGMAAAREPLFDYEHILWVLYHAGEGIDLTLILPGENRQETLTINEIACLDGFKTAMSRYQWYPIPEGESPDVPSGEPGMRMELASLDGSKSMTFQADVYCGFVTWVDEEEVKRWYAVAEWGTPPSIAEIRTIYDDLAAAPEQIEFFHDGGPDAVAEYFSDAYCQHLKSQAEGSSWKIVSYQMTSWEVEQVRFDGLALIGSFTAELTPAVGGFQDDGSQSPVSIGRQFSLERDSDGIWRCVQFGTGGCTLPAAN